MTAFQSASNLQQSEDDNVLVQGVEGDLYAIGFFGFAYYQEQQDNLKAVSVDEISPTAETAEDGSYALARPLFIYSDAKIIAEKPQVAAFLYFYLSNVNDNAPVITVTAVPVTENAVAVGTVVASFVASDADGDSLTYSLLNNADGYFALDGTNVVLTQAGVDAINDDALNLADLTISVQADDGSFQTSDSDISAITRINDNAPVITVTAVPVTEGSVALGDVIASFVASDASPTRPPRQEDHRTAAEPHKKENLRRCRCETG